MRKTCKNHPKNEPKTHQKSSKNKPKKHTEKTTTQKQPNVSQKVTKTRPTREGKGGIQDGILLEKKKNIAKTKPTAGKGCMREGNTQDTPNANTLRWAESGPGANLGCLRQ